MPSALGATFKYFNSRSLHYARVAVYNPIIAIPAFYATSSGGEFGSGGSATYRASIEYNGVIYPATFGGASAGVAPSNSILYSDPIPGLSIAKDAAFFCRIFGDCPSGVIYISGLTTGNKAYAAGGDRLEVSATSIPDRTGVTGVFTANNAVIMFRPIGILGRTNANAALNIGDSIDAGTSDTASSPDLGLTARGIGPFIGYAGLGLNSQSFSQYNDSGISKTLRMSLAQFATHIAVGLGTNDLNGTTGAAAVQSRYATFAAMFPGKTMVLRTIPPRTTGSFADGPSQTPTSWEAERVLWNQFVRSQPNFMEIADTQETSISGGTTTVRNGGYWKNSYTADGTHPLGTLANEAAAAASNSFKAAFGLA